MPKTTFNQLAPDKRERIISAAAALFARHGLDRADVAEIARRAGVAKGSLYNYFDSKDDLFLHVCRDGLVRFRQAVYGGLEPDQDLFAQIRHVFSQGAAFALDRPEYIRLYMSVSAAGLERFADELSPEIESFFARRFARLVEEGSRRGRVRPDLDVNLAAWLINSLYTIYMFSLVSRPYALRMKEYLKTGESISVDALVHDQDRVIAFLEQLLRPAAAAGPGRFYAVRRPEREDSSDHRRGQAHGHRLCHRRKAGRLRLGRRHR
ncbi:MAG: TetR/AcrR family transcriptional regulator [Thermodesulfobacteriota bacterium]